MYLETSVISYLASRPSHDLIVAANQQITRDWWEHRRVAFELYISQLVIQEVSAGNQDAAQARMRVIDDVPLLELNQAALALAQTLIQEGPIPEQCIEDALHIAVATVNGLDYLLTWNFGHIANAAMRYEIERVCRTRGYEPPVICTPQGLLEEAV